MSTGNGNAERSYPLRVPGWEDIPSLVHGFLGRAQALPASAFRRLDLERALRAAGEEPVQILAAHQVHGSMVLAPEDLDVACQDEDASMPGDLPDGDALVTASADVIVTIRTADCVPILLVAPRARAAAAVHAGWRGLTTGVVPRALETLTGRYGVRPGEIRAAIGPAIGGCCYEFGAEHHRTFARVFGPAGEEAWSAALAGHRWNPAMGRAQDHGEDRACAKPHLDVRILSRLALSQAGVAESAIQMVGPCTAEHPAELHSYRRDGPRAGRQLSYIGWRAV